MRKGRPRYELPRTPKAKCVECIAQNADMYALPPSWAKINKKDAERTLTPQKRRANTSVAVQFVADVVVYQ